MLPSAPRDTVAEEEEDAYFHHLQYSLHADGGPPIAACVPNTAALSRHFYDVSSGVKSHAQLKPRRLQPTRFYPPARPEDVAKRRADDGADLSAAFARAQSSIRATLTEMGAQVPPPPPRDKLEPYPVLDGPADEDGDLPPPTEAPAAGSGDKITLGSDATQPPPFSPQKAIPLRGGGKACPLTPLELLKSQFQLEFQLDFEERGGPSWPHDNDSDVINNTPPPPTTPPRRFSASSPRTTTASFSLSSPSKPASQNINDNNSTNNISNNNISKNLGPFFSASASSSAYVACGAAPRLTTTLNDNTANNNNANNTNANANANNNNANNANSPGKSYRDIGTQPSLRSPVRKQSPMCSPRPGPTTNKLPLFGSPQQSAYITI